MQLLTFVGTGKYNETTYTCNEQSATTPYIAEALVGFYPIESVIVGLTPSVKDHDNWFGLQGRLSRLGKPLVPVDITEGRSEEDQWRTFAALADKIAPETEIVIDITHALRSIPVIGVALATYLQQARGVKVKEIVYGAHELKDRATGTTPVVNLSPFLEMVEWVTAARMLSVSGDSRLLADLLQSKTADGRARKHGKALSLLGKKLRETSEALALNRPKEVADYAGKVIAAINALPDTFEPASAPFPLIRDAVQRTYEPIQVEGLEGALQLVEWYIERRRILQAVTLASEWLISFTGERLRQSCEKRADRERISGSLSAASRRLRGAQAEEGDPKREPLDLSRAEHTPLVKEWDWFSDLRNDLAHCGYRESSARPETIVRKAEEIPGRLKRLLEPPNSAEGNAE